MHWIVLVILIPLLALAISQFMPANPNAAVITTAAMILLVLKLIETKWTQVRRGPGLASVCMWIAYVIFTAAAAVVTYRDRSGQNIALMAIMLFSGLFLRFWPNWPRVITRVVNAERHQQLTETLSVFEDEEHPALQSYPIKRLARFAILEAGGQKRANLKLLADPNPTSWARVGPILSCWVVSGDGESAWPIDIAFSHDKATIALSPFQQGAPAIGIDLKEGEVTIRHVKSKPRPNARVAPPTRQNSYLTLANQMLAGASGKSKSELHALKREVAKRLHPDAHRGTDERLRSEALADANARLDQMIAYAK